MTGDVGRDCGDASRALLLRDARTGLARQPVAALRIELLDLGAGQRTMVEAQVIDEGVGIPPAVRARIFDPFFTTKDVGEGSGLGLSIVHGIIERHGGHIDVDSHLGQGTKFVIKLPLPPAGGAVTPRP